MRLNMPREILTLISLATLCSYSAACKTIHKRSSADLKIVNGRVTTTSEFPAVVNIIQLGPNDKGEWIAGSCTAAWVSDRTLLTAAHCADAKGDSPIFIMKGAGAGAKSMAIHRHEKYGTDKERDIALLVFPEGTSRHWVSLNTADAKVGEEVTLVGAGVTSFKEGADGIGIKRTGKNKISSITEKDIEIRELSTSPRGTFGSHGDSGGPLFDSQGLVIGVMKSGGQGKMIDWDSSDLKEVPQSVNHLSKITSAENMAWLRNKADGGILIRGLNLPAENSNSPTSDIEPWRDAKYILGVAWDFSKPNAVAEYVVAGMPAELVGIKAGDQITHINGQEVQISLDVMRIFQKLEDPNIQVKILRDGKPLEFRVTMRKKPESNETPPSQATPLASKPYKMGLSCFKGFLVVMDVEAGSPAQRAGVEVLDTITHVNSQEVSSVEDIVSIMKSLSSPKVVIRVTRGNRTLDLTLNF